MRVRKDVWEKGGQSQAGMIVAVVVVVGGFEVERVVHIVARRSPWE
jgi:hypothetical protein